jgi:hypothetical protein
MSGYGYGTSSGIGYDGDVAIVSNLLFAQNADVPHYSE